MGGDTPATEAHRILDRFLDAGGTFIDTADVYGDGGSERTLAPWLARHRDQVVIATKVRFAVSDPGGEGLAPDRIRAACEASLSRLGVDAIDLYQVHGPDPQVPLEDTLAALDGLVRAGKVRALGASNFPAWLLAWSVAVQDREGWAPFVSLQPQYSLVERSAELDLLPFCRAAGLGVLPWGPLGAGFLTGRYTRERMPPDGRVVRAGDELEESAARRAVERNFRVVDVATEIAARHGRPIAQVALAWLLGEPGVTAPIVGPRTLAQLDGLLGATRHLRTSGRTGCCAGNLACPMCRPCAGAGADIGRHLNERGWHQSAADVRGGACRCRPARACGFRLVSRIRARQGAVPVSIPRSSRPGCSPAPWGRAYMRKSLLPSLSGNSMVRRFFESSILASKTRSWKKVQVAGSWQESNRMRSVRVSPGPRSVMGMPSEPSYVVASCQVSAGPSSGAW